MDLSDIWTNIGFLIVAVLAAAGAYLRRPKREPASDPVLAGVGLGLMERQQAERLIAAVERIAAALNDKNTESINDKLEELADRLDEMKPSHRRGR